MGGVGDPAGDLPVGGHHLRDRAHGLLQAEPEDRHANHRQQRGHDNDDHGSPTLPGQPVPALRHHVRPSQRAQDHDDEAHVPADLEEACHGVQVALELGILRDDHVREGGNHRRKHVPAGAFDEDQEDGEGPNPPDHLRSSPVSCS